MLFRLGGQPVKKKDNFDIKNILYIYIYRERERGTERKRQTDRQTDRLTDRNS